MLTTAAGTITPARVFVIGAGVAGLQALATARRLGAVASAYDMRPAAKEQVQSLGGRFVELPIEAERRAGRARIREGAGRGFLPAAARAAGASGGGERRGDHRGGDAGQKIARAGDADMVKRMAPGSVIVDLASERGGNCELTRPGEKVVEHGVTIIGRYQSRQHGAVSRQPDVCAQCHRVPAISGAGREAAADTG